MKNRLRLEAERQRHARRGWEAKSIRRAFVETPLERQRLARQVSIRVTARSKQRPSTGCQVPHHTVRTGCQVSRKACCKGCQVPHGGA